MGPLREARAARSGCRHGNRAVSVSGLTESRGSWPDKLAELAVQKPLEAREEEDEEEKDEKKKKKKKRHPWKKRLVAARAKRKGGKKVKPAVPDSGHVQREKDSTDSRHRALKAGQRHGPIPVPVPTVPDSSQSQKRGRPDLASTGELLRCLSDFLCRRCVKVKELSSNQIVLWFRNVDRALLVQGWQDQCFISPASLVFVYLLCREAVDEDTSSSRNSMPPSSPVSTWPTPPGQRDLVPAQTFPSGVQP
ncbi:hypothetical protein INR49_010112 [Caranx melampygus]|nr:hypothetical protein INR49_010112 [Caranx melampygus]